MSPDRVLALLKADLSVPEPLEATPGHTPTRVLDAEEVSNAQKESLEPPVSHAQMSGQAKSSPEAKSSAQAKAPPQPQASALAKSSPDHRQPFEVMESLPARPPRAPKVPSEFSTIPADPAPRRSNRPAIKRRIKRFLGLLAMAAVVFTTTFLVTKGLRDESARVRAWDFISDLGARIGSWFSSQAEPPKPKTSTKVLALRADATAEPARTPPPLATAKPEAPLAPSAPQTQASASSGEASPPVVRLEDLELLKDCTGTDCAGAGTQAKSVTQRRSQRSRTR